jgi:hypothetical protein
MNYKHSTVTELAALMDAFYAKYSTIGSVKKECSLLKGRLNAWEGTKIYWDAKLTRHEYYQEVDSKEGLTYNDYVLSMVRLSPVESTQYKKATLTKNTADQSTNRRSFNHTLEYIAFLQDKAKSHILTYGTYHEKCAIMCCVTGRRFSEIGLSGSFESVGKYHVEFTGQLKCDNEKGSYTIPTLIDTDTLMALFAQLRRKSVPQDITLYTEGYNTQVNRAYHRLFDASKHHHFGINGAKGSLKDSRALYASITWYLYDKCTNGFSYHVASVLGHSENDLTTAQAYDDFHLVDSQVLVATKVEW